MILCDFITFSLSPCQTVENCQINDDVFTDPLFHMTLDNVVVKSAVPPWRDFLLLLNNAVPLYKPVVPLGSSFHVMRVYSMVHDTKDHAL